MDPITAILGSKALVTAIASMILGGLALFGLWMGLRSIKRAGAREKEQEAKIEGLDKAKRGSEKAREVERHGQERKEGIDVETPDSPFIKPKDRL